MTVTFILGGSRSGKSTYAEALANQRGLPVTYIATAPHIKGDADWAARIEQHRQQRPPTWQTIEEPLNIQPLLQHKDGRSRCILVDCLSLWLSNLMYANFSPQDLNTKGAINDLCHALEICEDDIILVSNELGMGLVPENKLGRDFRDAQGLLNQQVAQVADHVELVVAGLPLRLK